MQTEKQRELVPWPSGDLVENFTFNATASAGNFNFHFKWFNDQWNVWVTLPDGEVRQAGTKPGVTSWSEFGDFGIVFETEMETIDFDSLFMTELYIITWL